MSRLPPKIGQLLDGFDLVESSTGRLGDKILKYCQNGGVSVFLKIGAGLSAVSLENESKILNWLAAKAVNVPKVIAFETANNCAHLLISEIAGLPAHKLKPSGVEKVLKVFATALKQLHQTDPSGAIYPNVLERDLSLIEQYIQADLIDRERFRQNNQGKTPEQVYKYLISKRHWFDHEVVTHGDYCLPNLIIDGDSYGFIDMADCGVGDKYKDFSSAEVSIKRNFGERWLDSFYRFYGQKAPIDRKKIKYYQLVDQFDYCLKID